MPKGAQGTLSASSAQGAPSNSAYGAQSNSEGGCDALPALLHSVAMGVDSNSEMTV